MLSEKLFSIQAEIARRRHERDPVQMAFDLGFSPDPWQARLMRSQKRRIIGCTSRQAGKSHTAAMVALSEAVTKPKSLTLIVSRAMRQSRELFGKVRDSWDQLADLAGSGILPYEAPELELLEDNITSLRFANLARVVSIPANSSTVRGYSSVSLIILDEAAFIPDHLYRAVRPMLMISKGRLLMLSTPFGKRGVFYKEWIGEGDPTWERYEVKATMVPRISAEDLEAERLAMGPWWFEQEYMCKFHDALDQVFSYEDIQGSISAAVQPFYALPPGSGRPLPSLPRTPAFYPSGAVSGNVEDE